MKRTGNLFPHLVAWPNLLLAAARARRGKRFRPNVARFEFEQERELLRLQEELVAGSYRPGKYRTFLIFEPKRRLISAAPYRDRVVHHALCNIVEPLFERSFVDDSFACRQGKGTHAAVRRASEFARRYRYVLKADVEKFFPSIDHEILCQLMARKVKDRRVLDLIELVVDHSNPQEPVLAWFPGDQLFTPCERRRGLPIGNQTSQFFANVMLNPLDHFVKHQLRITGYVRYCDDVLLFSDDKRELARARMQVRDFLGSLRLRLHRHKSTFFPVDQGIRFLGYRIFPTHRLLDKGNVHRFQRRLRRMQRGYAAGRLSAAEIRARIVSWQGHASHASTYRLLNKILHDHPFQRTRP